VRHRKIRVMLIQESMVQQLLNDLRSTEGDGDEDTAWTAKLEHPLHNDRWQLMRKIAQKYEVQERRKDGKLRWAKPLGTLELCTVGPMSTPIAQEMEMNQKPYSYS